MERERIPPGDDPQFHLKLGRGSLSDVEWTAQLLQMQHGVRAAGTITAPTRAPKCLGSAAIFSRITTIMGSGTTDAVIDATTIGHRQTPAAKNGGSV